MPDAPPEHRQLAAIMFTDMVDYSALAQRDETLALELLEEHRQIARSLFPRFNGTEIKTISDAIFFCHLSGGAWFCSFDQSKKPPRCDA